MSPRRLLAVCVLGAVAGACAGSEPGPTLSIAPSGTVTASGPVALTANPAALGPSVTWTLSGPGTLSGSAGREVVYRPPSPVGATTAATVTATANGQTASVQLQLAAAVQPPSVISGLTAPVSVEYDAQQIPHIFCVSQLDCFAAQGYLQAQDRLFQMDLFRRTARGTLASLIGPLEAAQDQQFLTLFITRDGKRIEDQLVAALDAGTKAKLDAFASGVNAYLLFLKAHPALMPGEYAQIAAGLSPNDIPNWSPADTLAIGRLQQFQLSETLEKETGYGQFALVYGTGTFGLADSGKINTYIRPQQPINGFTLSASDTGLPNTSARAIHAPAALTAVPGLLQGLAQVNARMRSLREVFGTLREGAGSNNWVIDGAHAASGKAMVANDPHLSLQYPPLFHLSAMTASDESGLNLAGGAFPGIPGALIGRGAHVGWGVTVVGYDVTDIYQEAFVAPGAGSCPSAAAAGCVAFNGTPVPIRAYPYAVKVRGAADSNVTVLVVPHHGPVIHYDPINGLVLTMRWTGHEITNDLKAFLDLNNASAVGDAATAGTAFAALKNYAVGAQNFVLADDAGHIGYDPHAIVPRRPWLENPANWSDSSRYPWLPLPGTGTAEWGSGTAGDNCAGTGASAPTIPGPCWVADAALPQGKDPAKGYLATANSDPYGNTSSANPAAPFGPPGAPEYPYLSFDWDDPTDVRYTRIADVLSARTANSGKLSVADLQALQGDHAMLLARLFAPAFPPASALPPAQQASYGAALSLLTAWGAGGYDCPTGLTTTNPKSAAVTDATVLRDSAGCLLFHTFLGKLLHAVFDDDLAVVAARTGASFGGDFGAEIRGMLHMLDPAAPPADTSFCNDVNPRTGATVATRTCSDQVVAALLTAAGTLQAAYGADTTKWLWGRVHTLTTTSPAAPLIAGAYAAGPVARPGGAFTVDVGNPDGSQASPLGFAYSHGSNVRFIAEMDAPASAVTRMQLPGPQRDAPFGVFADTPDLFGQYARNQYFDYAVGHQADAVTVSTQGFTAQ